MMDSGMCFWKFVEDVHLQIRDLLLPERSRRLLLFLASFLKSGIGYSDKKMAADGRREDVISHSSSLPRFYQFPVDSSTPNPPLPPIPSAVFI